MELWDRNPTRALVIEVPEFGLLSLCFLFVEKTLNVAQSSPHLARKDVPRRRVLMRARGTTRSACPKTLAALKLNMAN